jgi:8-oxo-dGTP diphosphatase
MKKLIHVAVAIIFDSNVNSTLGSHNDNRKKGKVLIAKRADDQHQGGLWEFPGGKVEEGESVQVALQRELEEELGLQSSLENMRPLITIPFHYSDKSVLLDVWCVYGGRMPNTDATESALIGKEGQPLLWVDQDSLADYEFPAANKAIIDALSLPKKIAISQDNNNPEIILSKVANTLKNHANIWIQLRAPSLNQLQYTQLAMQLYGICHEAGSQLIWNCPLDWYQIAFADGLHLSNNNFKAASMKNRERPIPVNQWLSMACHNAPELEVAQELADYILVSPVHKTKTHPQANALTWAGFKEITEQARIPCYALGGLESTDLDIANLNGAQGIAGISTFITIKESNYEREQL